MTRRTRQHLPRRARRHALTAGAAALVLLLAACGDGDDRADAPTVDVDRDEVPDIDMSDVDTDALSEAENAGDVLDAMGIESKVQAMEIAIDAMSGYEIVDDKTAKIILDEDMGTGGVSECLIANGVVDADETIIVVLDGEEINCREL